MWESFAQWGGVAGLFVSLFAVIVLFLTRKNILDILDKDVILFDKNFELKNQAIQQAMHLIDELEANNSIKMSPEYNSRARDCYNALLCVITDVRVTDEFYNLTIDNTSALSQLRLTQFKLACRRDIGLRVKKSKAIKRLTEQGANIVDQFNQYSMDSYARDSFSRPMSSPMQPAFTPIQPEAPQPVAPVQPVVQPKPVEPVSQPTPVQSVEPATTPITPAPTQPKPAPTRPVRPVAPRANSTTNAPARPVRPMAKPQTSARRRPSNEDDKI